MNCAISYHNNVNLIYWYDDSYYCDWLAVNILSVYGKVSCFSRYAAEFSAKSIWVMHYDFKLFKHDVHEYMIYDESMIPYYLGQLQNKLKGIGRCEHLGK